MTIVRSHELIENVNENIIESVKYLIMLSTKI